MSLLLQLPGILGQQAAAPAGGPLFVADLSVADEDPYVESDTSVLIGGFEVVGNQLSGTTAWAWSSIEADGPTYSDYQWTKITVEDPVPAPGGVPQSTVLAINQTVSATYLLTSDSGCGYCVSISSDGSSLNCDLYVDGSWTHGFGALTWTAGDAIELRGIENGSGTDVSVWKNDTQHGSTYSHTTSLTGGHPGLSLHNNSVEYAQISAWSAGDEDNT